MKIRINRENKQEVHEVPNWLADQKQFLTSQPVEMKEIEVDFVKETEKAICVIADELIGEVWIPKNQLNKKEDYKPNIHLAERIMREGKEITEELMLQEIDKFYIEKFGIENVLAGMKKKIKELKEEK